MVDFNFQQVIDDYDEFIPLPHPVYISIPDAEKHLRNALNYLVNRISRGEITEAVWNEREYRPVVNWMTRNRGRGLCLIGSCGRGKTLIGKYALPYLIRFFCNKNIYAYSAQQLNANPEEVISRHLVYIDDVGTEDVSNIYGNKRIPFLELCDQAEAEGNLLIFSSNLTVPELSAKYGERTIDRLRATTSIVSFNGPSLRR